MFKIGVYEYSLIWDYKELEGNLIPVENWVCSYQDELDLIFNTEAEAISYCQNNSSKLEDTIIEYYYFKL